MDPGDSSRTPIHFRCTYTHQFTQESAYTKHQRSCTQGRKRLFSTLSSAKELLGSVKWSRVHGSGRPLAQPSKAPSNVQGHHPSDPSLSLKQVNEECIANPSNSSSTPLARQEDAPSSAFDTNVITAPMEIDENLSLAQRRSRQVNVPMPLRYRQYEDVLPQPPPSIPSDRSSLVADSIPPPNSSDVPNSTSPQAPPFHTARNVFGLVQQFFSPTPPSHDPEEVVDLRDISSVLDFAPVEPDYPIVPEDIAFHPYPNRSSFELGYW
ncbi:hypothetical protein BDR05DRAFT_1000741 [Suillus weaverae]|nr:hypothetical protein BDR05DRAFT_1000741 [Suillus weaverae]